MENDTVIVILAKAPEEGKVKTRLGKTIGNDWSAKFHAAFIEDLSMTLSKTSFDCVLCFDGDRQHPGFDPCRRMNFVFVPQPSGDLGDRLSDIAQQMFKNYKKVIIIGSDSPTLNAQDFIDADTALEENDVAIGPSFDGGYYLIALKKEAFSNQPKGKLAIFSEITWSSESVLGESLDVCRTQQHRCQLLRFWYDVDTVLDLNFLRRHLVYLNRSDIELGKATSALLQEFENRAV